jgi:TPR repeat protein
MGISGLSAVLIAIMHYRHLRFFAIASCLVATLAHQPAFSESTKSENDPEVMVREVREAAEGGSVIHQFLLGLFYETGHASINQDYEKAATWYIRAAEQGHAEAQHYLGQLYLHGDGVLINYQRAREWFEKSAAQGHTAALCELGTIYSQGLGVRKDLQRARSFFDQEALADQAWCMVQLAFMHAYGDGTPVDYAKAHELWTRAARLGSALAAFELGLLYRDGKGVERNIATAVKWVEHAASKSESLRIHDTLRELRGD